MHYVPDWLAAISVSIVCSFFAVLGLVLQKRALTAPGKQRKIGDFVLSWQWLIGLVLLFTGIPGDLIAYSLAPMSLTAPLSGVTVGLNAMLAPSLLGEQLQPSVDIPATLLILTGGGLTATAGAHQDPRFSLELLLQLFSEPITMIYLFCTFVVGTICIFYMHWFHEEIKMRAERQSNNPKLQHVLLPALTAAIFAGYTNLALKAFGVMARTGFDGFDQHTCIVISWIIFAFFLGCIQLNFVNRGLALYQQTIIVPVYKSLLIVSNTSAGLIVYGEYRELIEHPLWCFTYTAGVVSIAMGISLFRFRRDPVKKGAINTQALIGA